MFLAITLLMKQKLLFFSFGISSLFDIKGGVKRMSGKDMSSQNDKTIFVLCL